MSQIVLKDRNAADVVFTHVKTGPNALVYVNRGDSLLDSKVLTLTLTENANTNRVRAKLAVPSVGVDADGKSVVKYTQVASSDITIVKFSSASDRADISAMFASLAGNGALGDLIKDGAFPV